ESRLRADRHRQRERGRGRRGRRLVRAARLHGRRIAARQPPPRQRRRHRRPGLRPQPGWGRERTRRPRFDRLRRRHVRIDRGPDAARPGSGQPRAGLAAIDASTGLPDGWNPGSYSRALAPLPGGALAVGGNGYFVFRPGAPRITVVNQLAPTTDPGRFDLRVGSTVVRPAAGDGGTGSLAVAAGTYTVGEAPASGTDPANYTSSIACTKNGNPDVSGPGTSVDVTVASGDVEVCTTSNQRAARLTLRERLEPATDTGRFDLFAGPTLWAFAVADGGYNTAPIAVGTYTLSETAESGRLGDYVSSIACQLNGKPGPAGSGTSLHVTITYGDVL